MPLALGPLSGLHILLIEDEPAIVATLEDFLEEFGCATTACCNRTTALTRARQPGYDLALIDVDRSHCLTGFPVIAALTEQRIPLIATTQDADLIGMRVALPAGTPILIKPYSLAALYVVLVGLAARLIS